MVLRRNDTWFFSGSHEIDRMPVSAYDEEQHQRFVRTNHRSSYLLYFSFLFPHPDPDDDDVCLIHVSLKERLLPPINGSCEEDEGFFYEIHETTNRGLTGRTAKTGGSEEGKEMSGSSVRFCMPFWTKIESRGRRRQLLLKCSTRASATQCVSAWKDFDEQFSLYAWNPLLITFPLSLPVHPPSPLSKSYAERQRSFADACDFLQEKTQKGTKCDKIR